MRRIKMIATGGLAALTLAAFALPAMASEKGYYWTDNGVPLAQGKSAYIQLSGTMSFWGPEGGVTCTPLPGFGALIGNAENNAKGFISGTPKPENCKGTGARSECTVKSVTNDIGGWLLSGSPFAIASGTYLTFEFNQSPSCPVAKDTYGGAHLLTFNSAAAMNYWEFFAEINSSATGKAYVLGKYDLTPAGRYGIVYQ